MFNIFNAFSNGLSTGGASGGTLGGFPQVDYVANLPPASSNTNLVYTVLNPSGTWLIDRKEAGLYKSDGSTWTRLGNWIDAFKDGNLSLYNSSDITKVAKFSLSSLSSLTVRTYTLPNANGTLALTTDIPDIWDLQDLDDTGTVVYGGQIEVRTSKWRIKKVDSNGDITIANILNNVFHADYASAWTDRAILIYN